jgi:chromosomal replication initiator protein
VGLGKTHLLHAIGQEFIQNFPNKKVRYVTADEFIRGVYNSLNNQKLIEELKDKYQSYDLLLMDDIQFLANKDKANEILFHIFNHNINNGQIIIMTSDKPINQLNNFEDRMRSRFNSGLVVHIKNPDINTMRQILETKIQQEAPNFNFTKDAINYIINRNSRDIRSLEGHLNQIMFYALNNLPSQAVIDSSVVTKNLAGESQMKLTRYGYDADPDVVITAVCSAYGVDVDSVKSKIRTKKITTPRHVCMYVLRKKFNMPFAQIGSYLGGRDHSTIVEGINKINEYLKKDSNFKIFIENLYKKM